MNYEDNPRSIKYYVKKYILQHAAFFKKKTVIDFPAGNGITSRILKEIGATPLPFDLFPGYFTIEGLTCNKANIKDGLPIANAAADAVICQEGIEHFSDQLKALQEFNRVLQPQGILLVTTPNYSNIRAKLSYLFMESERFISAMPPNEIDSIWMTQQNNTSDIYYGHLFLTGIQKLRILAKLSGFKINKIYSTRIKSTSLLLFPVFYPFIYFFSIITYWKNIRKRKRNNPTIQKKVYKEIFKLAVNPMVLTTGNLMVEFIKEAELKDVSKNLQSKYQEFGAT